MFVFPVIVKVSIHAPTQGATLPAIQAENFFEVSIHAPTQGATVPNSHAATSTFVSIHAPTQGATLFSIATPVPVLFQSTRPRRARRESSSVDPYHETVSIHAPTQGATRGRQFPGRECPVSIHAPTQGATSTYQGQSRDYFVSIHAPTQGATYFGCHSLTSMPSFNPRAHAGRDANGLNPNSVNSAFQSTRPRRARRTVHKYASCFQRCVSIHAPTQGATRCNVKGRRAFIVSIHAPTQGATGVDRPVIGRDKCFNPRAHAGRDCKRFAKDRYCDVSIHAPTQGATRVTLKTAPTIDVSIHAPTQGATRPVFQTEFIGIVSIHAPTQGATLALRCIQRGAKFQSTRPRRARRYAPGTGCSPRSCFNPRAHAGRDWAPYIASLMRERFNPRAHAGRDYGESSSIDPYHVSIHAPTQGATDRSRKGLQWQGVSIHAPTQGATKLVRYF